MIATRRGKHRARHVDILDVFVFAFFLGVAIVGVLGVTGFASLSAEERLPSQMGVVLWCACYALGAVAGVGGRIARWHRVEGVAFLVIAAATALHAQFLLSSGPSGIQTGVRLVSGICLILGFAVIAFREAKVRPLEAVVAQVLRERAEDVAKEGGR